MRSTNKIGQRVRALRKKLDITQQELSDRIGFVRNYISLVENGREPSRRFIRAIESIEQPEIPHIIHQNRAVTGPEANLGPQAYVRTGIIPLLSWAEAGTPQAWDAADGECEGVIGFNMSDPKAVAVQIRGDSMAPQFPQGTTAIVYPSFEAKSGDLVIARLKDGTVMFKRLHVDGDHCIFISLNPIYPPLTVEKSKVEKILPVGGTYQNQL